MLGPLAELGYRLIAPSRFGYLRSASPADPTSAKQADAYALLLDRLGVQQADVVAVSAGAWSALQFAVRRPDRCRALVLVVAAPAAPAQANDAGAAFVRAMFGSDFLAWAAIRLAPILPAAATRAMLGSDPALVRAAEPSERARARQILDRFLPVSPRLAGTAFDIRSAANPEPCAIDKISCPVLTISAADDAFGTADRAKAIAAGVANGAAVIYPSGGHALVGDYGTRAANRFVPHRAAGGARRVGGSDLLSPPAASGFTHPNSMSSRSAVPDPCSASRPARFAGRRYAREP